MYNELGEHPADDEDVLKLNTVRSDLVLWIVERFQYLRAEGRECDALDFADEWFEWLSPDDYINESTLFFNENELKELYESIKN
tara:strand:+ start:210 stop:461 length:252 start_codon:yes stop_codon:yes gene_type:complete